MKKLLYISIVLLVACSTYDKSIVYQPDYNPGQNNMLRFDGYYSDTLHVDPMRSDITYASNSIRPKFFYTNGTGILGGNLSNEDTLSAYLKRGWSNIGDWSNYRIINDTIQIEYYHHNGGTGNSDRFILTGIIQPNKIYFPIQTIREGLILNFAYYSFFHAYSTKPDSTKNWIRTKKFYK